MAKKQNEQGDFIQRWQLQLRKGLLAFLVLASLGREDHYGYSLITSLSRHLGIAMAEGTIYPLLSRLQREKLVVARWQIMESGPARKYYSITPTGRAVLAAMDEHWQKLDNGVDTLLGRS